MILFKDLIPLLVVNTDFVVWCEEPDRTSSCVAKGSCHKFNVVDYKLYNLYGSYPVKFIGCVNFTLTIHLSLPSLYKELYVVFTGDECECENEGLFEL